MVFPTTTPFPVIINPTQSLGQVIIEVNPVSGKSPLTVSFYAGFLLPDGDDACAQGGSCRYYWDVNGKSSRTMSYTFREALALILLRCQSVTLGHVALPPREF